MQGPWLRSFAPLLRRLYSWHNARVRRTRFMDLDLLVLPGVFHPAFFDSTRALCRFLRTIPLRDLRFLDLGTGSGAVAIFAAKAGALVTASDVKPEALRCAGVNAARNHVPLTSTRSDLFHDLPQHFDIIAINPPYYPHDPRTDAEHAFFAGEDLAYFKRLFAALPSRIAAGTRVYMVLSEALDMEPVNALAAAHGIVLIPRYSERNKGETQTVLAVELSALETFRP